MDDRASKTKGLAWFVLACVIGGGFACGLSPLAHAIPWSCEKALGNLVDTGVRRECTDNVQAYEALQKLVKRLYPVASEDSDFSIDVHIVEDSAVNAYATLGGKIYVNSGLLKQAGSAEELAGVIAHEIGHVQNRHIMEGVMVHSFTAEGVSMLLGRTSSAGWVRYFLRMDFTRSQEAQADEAGLMRLQKAHISNKGFRDFFERMQQSGTNPVFLSDHPSNEARMEMTEHFSNQDTQPVMTPDEWHALRNYCNAR